METSLVRRIKSVLPKSAVNKYIHMVELARAWKYGKSRNKKRNSTFYCNVCERYYVSPFPLQISPSENDIYNFERFPEKYAKVVCPGCISFPRHRIEVKWFRDNIELLKKSNILYFAREEIINKWLLKNGIKSTSSDLFNPADLKLDIQDTGLEEGKYDFIIANHVLEHVDSTDRAVNEMYRILPKGGYFLCSFPMTSDLDDTYEDPSITTKEGRLKAFGQSDHLRVFGKNAEDILSKPGFKVTIIDGDNMPDIIAPFIGPADYDSNKVFLCQK